MAPEYDADRLRECMFDPDTAPALAELESGPKSIAHLAEKCGMTQDELAGKLAYMVECGFLARDGSSTYTADSGKLTAFMENDDTYGSIIDSVTVMDSYLN